MQYVTKITVKGQEFGVYIESGGRFYCNVGVPYNEDQRHNLPELGDDDPNVIEARSLQELQKKAKARLDNTRTIAIDVWRWESGYYGAEKDERIVHGVLVGQHANRNLLIRWDEGGRRGRKGQGIVEQYSSYHDGLLKLDTDEKRQELKELKAAKRKAEKDLETFVKKHVIDGAREVQRALGIKVVKGGA